MVRVVVVGETREGRKEEGVGKGLWGGLYFSEEEGREDQEREAEGMRNQMHHKQKAPATTLSTPCSSSRWIRS